MIHGLSEGLGIGIDWIEVAANPSQAVGALLVVRISDCVEEVAIPPGSADILWWAAAGCFDKARVGDARHGISDTYPPGENRLVGAIGPLI